MRARIAWERCPDCGRSGTNGGCYIVERRGLFGWKPLLVLPDRGGNWQAQHFPTEKAAEAAFRKAVAPKEPAYLVIRELSSSPATGEKA